MDINSIAYAVYLDYMGKKSSIMDSVCLARARVDKMKEDEKVYSLISIMRLYLFAGFIPVFENVESSVIKLRNGEEEIIFDLPNYDSEKERVVELINAIAMQPEFDSEPDRMIAVFKELKTYYDMGKEFTTMLNNYLAGSKIENGVIAKAIESCTDYLEQYSTELQENDKTDNMTNVVISEAKEDLEEILALRNNK